jgi:hypothetical protein
MYQFESSNCFALPAGYRIKQEQTLIKSIYGGNAMKADSTFSVQNVSAADDHEKMIMQKADDFLSQIFLIPESAIPAS